MDWNSTGKVTREAFRDAVNDWIGRARISGGRVQGPTAILTPGSLVSDANIETMMVHKLITSGVPPEIARPLATTLAAAWNAWAAGLQIQLPGAYPALAAFPGPFAPPTPAPAFPLALGTSAGEASLRAPVLAERLSVALRPHAGRLQGGSFTEAVKDVAEWIQRSFQEWKGLVTIVGVMGSGPVPTFAPPYVPVGPVIMGQNSSAAPVFAGPRFGRILV